MASHIIPLMINFIMLGINIYGKFRAFNLSIIKTIFAQFFAFNQVFLIIFACLLKHQCYKFVKNALSQRYRCSISFSKYCFSRLITRRNCNINILIKNFTLGNNKCFNYRKLQQNKKKRCF